MSVGPMAFVKQVAALSPALTTLLEDHVKDNFGEVLPHVFLGDVTRHVIALVRAPGSEDSLAVRREVKTILDTMEHGYATGSPEVQELIAASFLENLPAKGEPGSGIRGMVGPSLGSQLTKMT
jgi:hypothetical protein